MSRPTTRTRPLNHASAIRTLALAIDQTDHAIASANEVLDLLNRLHWLIKWDARTKKATAKARPPRHKNRAAIT